ncbi:phosphodiesterase [Ktedonobacter sp. SOSP1-52]|uniref:alkaline phosphatase family protein n=1 Tax=Ktedonobacter sp. SOSP1-52 TaxID=2778366 RepID=UPI001916069C|nr:alkaline phosphatase family protein [Ktedonobacter sp. SOSP1-52]GHO66010.1 phosphodiesterase [Ktedonobacter sp. SOSP1-52]
MLNTASIKAVSQSKFSQRFVKPCYGSYCFAYLPATIRSLLTGTTPMALPADILHNLPTRYEQVVFLFVDGFGWHLFKRHAERYAFLTTAQASGVVSKLTSQFPSTTAAHVTCIHTGLEVGQSGVYEWHYYEPLVDNIISPLLFSYADDKVVRDTLKRASVPATAFFPRQTFYQSLQDEGVNSHIFQYQAYTPSTYSDIVFRGAQVHPYTTIQEALGGLADLLVQPPTAPTYYFLYFDRIDTASHNYGPFSPQVEREIDVFMQQMEQFYQRVASRSPRTLLLLSADHGQTPVNPRTTYYLNERLPQLIRYLKTNHQGRLLIPAGSPRDMFLHVKEPYVDEVVTMLRQHLADKAEVYPVASLIAQQFFGLRAPSQTLLSRLGNVVILPYKHETVWWYEQGTFDMHFQGHHGGLTPDEMEIPLLALPL